MKEYLYPDVYVESILDLPLGKLYQYGIRAFIMDLDNTVTEWNSCEVRDEVVAWMQEVKDRGFKACIASNNGRERVVAVAEGLNTICVQSRQTAPPGFPAGFAGNGQRGG